MGENLATSAPDERPIGRAEHVRADISHNLMAEFDRQLPEMVARVSEKCWCVLREGRPEAKKVLHGELYSLSGSAAVFEYSELGCAAYAMQAELERRLGPEPLPHAVLETLLAMLVRLKSAMNERDPIR